MKQKMWGQIKEEVEIGSNQQRERIMEEKCLEDCFEVWAEPGGKRMGLIFVD